MLIYERKGEHEKDNLLIALNMTPVPRDHYRIGLFKTGTWKEIFNSDLKKYGGSQVTNPHELKTQKVHHKGKDYSIEVTLPPLAAIVLKKI